MITIENDDSLVMKGSGKVSIESGIAIVGTSTTLPVTIVADFSNVPKELHETYYQAFVYQYRGISAVYDNTKKVSSCECKKSNIDKIIDLVCNPKNWFVKK